MLEPQQAPLLPPGQQHGEPHMVRARPQVRSNPFLQLQQRHWMVAGSLQGRAPVLVRVEPPVADEPRQGVQQQGLARLRPCLAEEPPPLAVLRRLDRPGDLAFHGRGGYLACRSAALAAWYPHMPWTPPPGGVEAEQR